MAKYKFNAIYTRIVTAASAVESGLYCSAKYEPVPEQFPALYVEEVSSVRTPGAITLDYTDEQHRVVHEVQVWSNLLDGAKAQADAIMDAVETAYNAMYFRQTMKDPMPTTDRSIYRLVARFTKQIAGGDTLPGGD